MRLQLAGTVLVISTLLAAEVAALALAAKPSSAFLWWLNLEVFRPVSATYRWADTLVPLDYQVTIVALVTLLVLALGAFRFRQRFMLAVLSNLALVYSVALAIGWYVPYGGAPVATASLEPVHLTFDLSRALVIYLLFGSLAGAAASHLTYLRRLAGRRKACTADATLPPLPPG